MSEAHRDPAPEDERTALQELEKVLLRIPGLDGLVRDVRELRALLIDRRPPRVAAIGRRGSGKSSLANALMGAQVLPTGAVTDTTEVPQWVDLVHNGRRLRWLDTPGLRAAGASDRTEEVHRSLIAEPPDVILLTIRATQVDAGVDEDLAEVKSLLERQKRAGLVPPAVVAVVTRVDELAPVTVKRPPFEGEKRANIDRAVAVLRGHLDRAGIVPCAIVPVATYMRCFRDGTVAIDWRWNLETLAEVMDTALPLVARVEAARAFECTRVLRRRVATRIVSAATSLAFFVGATPLPIADVVLLAPLQSAMVTGVVVLGRGEADARTVAEWLASLGVNTGAGFGLRQLARVLIKWIPGWAGPLSGAVAATGTWAIGMSAIRYFIDGVSKEEARVAFDEARRSGPPAELTRRDAGDSPTHGTSGSSGDS